MKVVVINVNKQDEENSEPIIGNYESDSNQLNTVDEELYYPKRQILVQQIFFIMVMMSPFINFAFDQDACDGMS